MTQSNAKRVYAVAAALVLAQALGVWLAGLHQAQRQPLLFDDAYMFWRYALHMRHGLGLSWNLDGAHTYGQTSLLWSLVVCVLSYLPLQAWTALTFASWLCSLGAVFVLARAVARNAKSDLFRTTWHVLPWIVVPLTMAEVFTANQVTGMETMLAVLLTALLAGCSLAWVRGEVGAWQPALLGWLLFLTRPEMGLVAVLLPISLYFLLPERRSTLRSLLLLLGLVAAAVAATLFICHIYFHTSVPLSFYMKSRHAYRGYAEVWHPALLLFAFLAACQVYLGILFLLARRADVRLVLAYMLPALAVFAYLLTVTQIMGFNARYYVPCFALFVLPALLIVDRWLAEGRGVTGTESGSLRVGITAAMIVGFLLLSLDHVQNVLRHFGHPHHVEYAPAVVTMAATTPLPWLPWGMVTKAVADDLVAPLPAGATVAASEVGYLGARAPQVNIIDLAGLNDTQIALHGFSVAGLLARKPDLIWLPNTNYTYQHAQLLSDPVFLRAYDVYAGAADYGIAVRKDSPLRPEIEKHLAAMWAVLYPGYPMQNYEVSAASWSGARMFVPNP